jgi:hypothetical protein
VVIDDAVSTAEVIQNRLTAYGNEVMNGEDLKTGGCVVFEDTVHLSRLDK